MTWERPDPITAPPTLPEFPVDVLPKVLAEYVEAAAVADIVDPSMTGSVALAVLSAACVGRIKVNPWGSWIERGPVWTCVVAPPGARKSAVYSRMTRPLLDAQKELTARAREGRDDAVAIHTAAVKAEKSAINALADAMNGSDADAIAAAEAALALRTAEVAETYVKPLPTLFGDDVTSARLHDLIAENGGRFALFVPEGAQLFHRLLAGNGESLGPYLKGHAGDFLRKELVGRKVSDVDDPAMVLSVMVQPETLAAQGMSADLERTGFSARFLYASPPSIITPDDAGPRPSPDAFLEADYNTMVRAMVDELWTLDEPRVLTLTTEAREAFTAYQRRVIAWSSVDDPMPGFTSKLAGSVLRIAGAMAVFNDPTVTTIDAVTVADACEIGNFYFASMWQLFGDQLTPAGRQAELLRKVLKLCARHYARGRTHLSVRDVQRGVREFNIEGGHNATKAVLMALELHDWLRAKGGVWEINPRVGTLSAHSGKG